MSVVWSDHRADDALALHYGNQLIAAQAKIAALAFELAQCRPFIAWEVDHPYHAASKDHTAFVTRRLAGIDAALDGTIHSFTKNGVQR